MPNEITLEQVEDRLANPRKWAAWQVSESELRALLTLAREALMAREKVTVDVERELRMVWWFNHGCSIAARYGDDGEMQCGSCRVDFKRRDLAELREHVHGRKYALLQAALIREPAPQVSEPNGEECGFPGCGRIAGSLYHLCICIESPGHAERGDCHPFVRPSVSAAPASEPVSAPSVSTGDGRQANVFSPWDEYDGNGKRLTPEVK